MFIEKQSELLLAAPIGGATANINEAIIHDLLSIENWMWSKKQKTVKDLWRKQIALIIKEINMVLLKLLATVDTQLSQAKGKSDNDISILSVKERLRGKSANHQSLLPRAQRDAQREWMKLSYQSRGAIT